MASATPANGSYLQQADPQNFPNAAADTPQQQSYQSEAPATEPAEKLNTVDVAWCFIESYYTTLNKTPQQVHLFYNKRSVLVWGTEGETLPVARGRVEIQERMAAQEFNNCKVRISNVDAQSSTGEGIVIQVLGEMSHNGVSNRKFAQTFFLAPQPGGYYVLNDIFRYLKDDDDIEEGEDYETTEQAVADIAAEVAEEAAQEIIEELQDIKIKETTTVEVELDESEKVKVEETHTLEPELPEAETEEPVPVNGTPAEETDATPAASEPEKVEETPAAPETETQPEPPAPAPAPAPEPVTEKPAPPKEPERPAPAPAPVPARPKTWANLVAGNTRPAAPVPAVPTVAAQAPTPAKSPVPAASQPPQTPSTPPAPATPSTPTTPGGGSQWQTADSKRHSRANASPGGQTLAFIKGVTESVSEQALKDTLSKYGGLKYLEINRTRNSALAEFSTAAGFSAANTASPHMIAGSGVLVEERRRSNNPYGNRSNMASRGDGRSSGQGGRGGFQPRDGQRGGRGGSNSGRAGFSGGRGFRTGTQNS